MENETIQKPSFWAILPASVRYDTRLRPNAKLLYAEITALQEACGYCFASNQYLADNFGVKPDTISRLLSNLVDVGYIDLEIIRDQASNEILERRIRTTNKLPEIADPLSDKNPIPYRKNIQYPIGKKSDKNNTSNNNIPPKAPQGGQPRKKRGEPKANPDWKPDRFNGFWAFYPRGENKQGAIRAWDKLKPSDELIDQMAVALKAQKRKDDWIQGIGIPYASTWINQRRWEDNLGKGMDGAMQQAEPDVRGGLPEW